MHIFQNRLKLTISEVPSPRMPDGVRIRTPPPSCAMLPLEKPSPRTIPFGLVSAEYMYAVVDSLPFLRFKPLLHLEASRLRKRLTAIDYTSVDKLLTFQPNKLYNLATEPSIKLVTRSFFQTLRALLPENMFPQDGESLQLVRSENNLPIGTQMFDSILFLFSNVALARSAFSRKEVYTWIQCNSDTGFLEYVSASREPTAEALTEQLFLLAIEENHAEMVKKLLNFGLDAQELRFRTYLWDLVTPLQRACELRYLNVVRILLDSGADVNESTTRTLTPLSCAVRPSQQHRDNGNPVCIQLVQTLLQAGAKVNPGHNDSPLCLAVRQGSVELTEILLSSGADPNHPDASGTPLLHAIRGKAWNSSTASIIRLLLQAGASICTSRTMKECMLATTVKALKRGNKELVEILLSMQDFETNDGEEEEEEEEERGGKKKMDVEGFVNEADWCSDNDENKMYCGSKKVKTLSTAVITAIHEGRKDLIDRMLTEGIDLRLEEWEEAIKTAIQKRDVLATGFLLDLSAKHRGIIKSARCCLLSLSIEMGQSQITQLLLAAGANVNGVSFFLHKRPIWAAVKQKDADISRKLLAAGASVNGYETDAVRSILSEVVAWGHHELVDNIINAGADLEAPSKEGGPTALTVAVEKGDLIVVKRLLDAGADVNAPSINRTALEKAVESNNIGLVHYLLARGAETTVKSLNSAVFRGLDLVKALLQAKVARYQRIFRGFGSHALQHAIVKSNEDMIKLLLENGVDPHVMVRFECKDCDESLHEFELHTMESAFGTAINFDRSKDQWIVQTLLSHGADPNKIAKKGYNGTPLLMAIEKGDLALVESLIAAGANINPRLFENASMTPLQFAVGQGEVAITLALIEKGADVNAPPYIRYGATALQLAAIKGYVRIACLLLEKGADVNAGPAKIEGRTALEGACEHGRIDMLDLLLKSGVLMTGLWEEQYNRARVLATKNGHIAVRRLLDAHYAKQVERNAIWDCLSDNAATREDVEH